MATTAAPRTATGKGAPVSIAMVPAVYAALPQNAACPNESSPVNPSSRSSATANSAHATMSIATGG